MDLKCTRLLKQLKAYTEEIANSLDSSLDSRLLKDVTGNVEVDKDSGCYRLLKLLKELEDAAKISKLIRKRFQREDLDKSEDVSIDTESFQETPVSVGCPVESSVSAVEDKTAEPLQDTSLPVECSEELSVSAGEGKTAESSVETVVSPELSVGQNVNIEVQNKNKKAKFRQEIIDLFGSPEESSMEATVSSELPVEKNVSIAVQNEDKKANFRQEIIDLFGSPAESSMGTAVSSELPIEQSVSIEDQNKDKKVKFCHEILDLFSSSIETLKERKTFRVMIDVSNFLPKEISVKIFGKCLVVQGEHEPVFDEHGKISRKFTRKFEIPEDVDTETFRALFDCYRVLTIEASFKTKNGDFDVQIHEETGGKQILSTFKDLGPEFVELADHFIKEAEFMRDFARNLAKQGPSDYIPIEEVIPPPM